MNNVTIVIMTAMSKNGKMLPKMYFVYDNMRDIGTFGDKNSLKIFLDTLFGGNGWRIKRNRILHFTKNWHEVEFKILDDC